MCTKNNRVAGRRHRRQVPQEPQQRARSGLSLQYAIGEYINVAMKDLFFPISDPIFFRLLLKIIKISE